MVRKIASSEAPGDDLRWDIDADAEKTVERRVRVAAPPSSLYTTRLTKRMTAIDPRLLAIARGEIEPEPPPPSPAVTLVRPGRVEGVEDDPFGGLIPVLEDETTEVEERWLEEVAETATSAAAARAAGAAGAAGASGASEAPVSAVARSVLDSHTEIQDDQVPASTVDLGLELELDLEDGWTQPEPDPEPFSNPRPPRRV